MLKLPFLILVLLIVSVPLQATSYFVTQAGAGSHNGLSLGNAFSVANYNASAAPTGGDTVSFSGTITSTVTVNTSGTGNGASRLVLDFTAATLTAPAIDLAGHGFLTLNGGAINDGGTNGSVIINCSAAGSNVKVSGFSYSGSTNVDDDFMNAVAGCNNFVFSGNTVSFVAHCVVFNGGHIDTWDIANNSCTSNNTVTNFQTDMIFVPDATNITIEGNFILNQAPGQSGCCHNDGIQTFKSGAGGAVCPSNLVIRYNWIERAVPAGGSGDNSWNEMENLCGQPAIKYYGNVFVGETPSISGGNGLSVHSGTNASDTYFVYNNTFYRHQQPCNAIRLGEGDGPGTLFWRNNVAAQDASAGCQMTQATFTAGATWDYNFFSSNWDTCSSTFTGIHGTCSAVPNFVNTSVDNFALRAGSALINAGDSTIGAEFNQGPCAGATWPNPALCARSNGAWDVGAFQSSSLTTPPGVPRGLLP